MQSRPLTRCLCLGVDGGGTTTEAVLIDHCDGGRVLGTGRAGSSNKNSVGFEAAVASLRAATDAALQAVEGGACLERVAAVVCGVSGVDSEADAVLLKAAMQGWFPGISQNSALLRVCNDAVPALCSGTGGCLEGVVLIAGTGTVAFGAHRHADGAEQTARAAGWGGAFLDGGSGYDVGQRALAAVARAVDGRGPPSALVQALCTACGVTDLQDPMPGLLRWAYHDANKPWASTAALAECVAACAVAGDQVASSILDAAAQELCGSVEAVCRQLGLDTQSSAQGFNLVLAGGMLQQGSLYAERVKRLWAQRAPAARVVHAGNPALGAALHAVHLLRQVEMREVNGCE